MSPPDRVDPQGGPPRLVIVAAREMLDTLVDPMADASRLRVPVAEWVVAEPEAEGRPLPVQAGRLLARIAHDERPLYLAGLGERALLTFEVAAQLVAHRRPPAGLALVDPPPVPSAEGAAAYRPPLLDLRGLLVLHAELAPVAAPVGPTGTPLEPDPRLEWVAQFRRTPALVRLEGGPFDTHDLEPVAGLGSGTASGSRSGTASGIGAIRRWIHTPAGEVPGSR